MISSPKFAVVVALLLLVVPSNGFTSPRNPASYRSLLLKERKSNDMVGFDKSEGEPYAVRSTDKHSGKEFDVMTGLAKSMKSLWLATSLLLGSAFVPNPNHMLPHTEFLGVPPAHAETSKIVGALKGSGLVFKDTLNIERFEDPKVKGVVLYISNFDRPITEKLNGSFFNDPSQASVACARTSPVISIADNIQKGPQGEEVFQESKSLLFKSLRVQRIYDTETNTVVYVSYNTRLDKGDDANKSRFKSSLCAINLNDDAVATPTTASAAPSAAKQ